MNKKINILLVSEDSYPIIGGVPTVVHESALALSRFANVTVATVEQPKNIDIFDDSMLPYKVIRCRGSYNKITTNMSAKIHKDKNFRNFIGSENFDIIHCHFPLSLYKYVMKIAKKKKIPIIITCHALFYLSVKEVIKSSFLARLATKFVVNIHNKADHIWVVTKYCKDFLLDFNLRKDSIVVENGVNISSIIPASIDFEKKYGISNKDFLITSVGRLVKIKNNALIINSLQLIKENFKNVKFAIVGNGEQLDYLKKLAIEKNVHDICIFVGAIYKKEDLMAFYKRTNLISFVSLHESAGLVQVEAAYFNKPTIALYGTAVSEKMIDKENGLICENDKVDCSEKIMWAINNQKKLTEIGDRAKIDLYRGYETENLAKELYNNYILEIENYKAKITKV